jgi:glycine betaine/choline ABC-type transport system substrate-binding protein
MTNLMPLYSPGRTSIMKLTRRGFIATSAAGATVSILTNAGPALAQDDKPTIAVGSKDFTESVLLGEIVAYLLEDSGFPVERQLNLGGSVVAHEALVNGDIDLYVEYTGTGLLAVLQMELPQVDPAASPAATPEGLAGVDPVYEIVAREYPERYQAEWLQPWGFNNTWALAMRGEHAEELGITTISGLAEQSGDLVFGTTAEFIARPDGLPGLEETYGLDFSDITSLDPGLLYSAVDDGEVDVISGFATDGRVAALGLTLLEDDKRFFPPYYAAPVVRQELLEEAPEVRDILNQLAGRIDDVTMAELNYEVDEGGEEPSDVAREFLITMGLIEG